MVRGLTGEQQMAAYEAAGEAEKKLARDLARLGTRGEADLVLEIYHHFPGARLVKSEPRPLDPADRD